jgi:hypothetical protein
MVMPDGQLSYCDPDKIHVRVLDIVNVFCPTLQATGRIADARQAPGIIKEGPIP